MLVGLTERLSDADPDYYSEKGSGEPEIDKLKRVEEEYSEEIIQSDRKILYLVAVGEKKGGDIECFFRSRQRLEDFLSLLKGMGVTCFVKENPEETNVESFMGVMDDESPDMIEDCEVKARIWLTLEEDYSCKFFENLEKMKDLDRQRYHRIYGEFIGLADEDIDVFLRDQETGLRRKILDLLAPVEDAVTSEELVEEYGGDLDEEEKKEFVAFTFGMAVDSKSAFERKKKLAERRREKLEEYKINIEQFLESAEFFLE